MDKDISFVITMLNNVIDILKEKEYGNNVYTSNCTDNFNYNSNIRDKIIEEAKKLIGKPYKYGADGPDEFDCSGFVQYVYKKVGLIPANNPDTNSLGMREWGQSTTCPRKGDLLCYEGHVAIYLDENTIIHASSGSKRIIIASKNIGKPILAIRNLVGD